MTSRPRKRVGRRAPTGGDVAVLLLVAAAIPASHAWTRPQRAAARLVVQCGDAPPYVVDARRDREFELHGPVGVTRVQLQDGRAWIAAAPCRQRICQGLGRVDGPGRVLVCLPNRVVVRFAGLPRHADALAH